MKRLYFFLILLLANYFSYSQLTFTPADSISVTIGSTVLNNPWVGGINFPLWSNIDLNGDGILDLFCYDMTNDRITTYVNDGTQSEHPFRYAPQYASKFPKPPQGSWAKCFDYNCDGKYDYFTLDSLLGGIAVWRNDYTVPSGLVFTQVSKRLMETSSNPSSTPVFASSILIPTFIDMDSDGDMDILGFNSSPDGHLAFHRNYSKENYGICDSLIFKYDTKCWGNFKLCLGSNKVCSYGEVCPPPMPSEFIEPQYKPDDLAPPDDTVTTLFALDIDGDGLKDVLIGDLASRTTLMVHNAGNLHIANADSQDTLFPNYDTPINIPEFVFHSYLDLNNDGKRDLLASAGFLENKDGIWQYDNVGTDAAPIFNLRKENFMQEEMIEEGEAAAPVFFDYDSDGLLDMVIGYGVYEYPNGVKSHLALYKNTGTSSQPAFQLINDDYATLSTYALQTPIYPAFGDLDGDGDYDLIIGQQSGWLYYFMNTAGAGNVPVFQFVSSTYMRIRPGNATIPQIIDLDRDSKPDLLIGEQNGTLNFFKNIGTVTAPFFDSIPTIDTLGFVNVQHNSVNGFAVPFVFSDSSHYKMMVSSMHGEIFLYGNIEGNLNGVFTRIDTLISDSLGERTNGINLTISGGDLNNDGKTDFVVGLFSGGVKIYYGNEAIVGINEISGQPQLFDVYPNPANSSLNIRVLERMHDKNLKLVVFNSLGEKVIEKEMNSSFSILDTRSFSEGTYFIQVVSSNASQFRKVVIHH